MCEDDCGCDPEEWENSYNDGSMISGGRTSTICGAYGDIHFWYRNKKIESGLWIMDDKNWYEGAKYRRLGYNGYIRDVQGSTNDADEWKCPRLLSK